MKPHTQRPDLGLLNKRLAKTVENLKDQMSITPNGLDPGGLSPRYPERQFSSPISAALEEIANIKGIHTDRGTIGLLAKEETLLKKCDTIMKTLRSNDEHKPMKKVAKAPVQMKLQVNNTRNAKIKHLNSNLLKDNQKHRTDLIQPNLPVIEEANRVFIGPNHSKVIDNEDSSGGSSIEKRKNVQIIKSGFDPVVKTLKDSKMETCEETNAENSMKNGAHGQEISLFHNRREEGNGKSSKLEQNSRLDDSAEMARLLKQSKVEEKHQEKGKETSFQMKSMENIFSRSSSEKSKEEKIESAGVRASLETKYIGDSIDNLRQPLKRSMSLNTLHKEDLQKFQPKRAETRQNKERIILNDYGWQSGPHEGGHVGPEGNGVETQNKSQAFLRQNSLPKDISRSQFIDEELLKFIQEQNKDKKRPFSSHLGSIATTDRITNTNQVTFDTGNQTGRRNIVSEGSLSLSSKLSSENSNVLQSSIRKNPATPTAFSGQGKPSVFRPKTALHNEHLFPEAHELYIPQISRPISATHQAGYLYRKACSIQISTALDGGTVDLASPRLQELKKSILSNNSGLGFNTPLSRAASNILENSAHSNAFPQTPTLKKSNTLTVTVNPPAWSRKTSFDVIEQDFNYKELPSLNTISHDGSVPFSKSESIDFGENNSFCTDNNNYLEVPHVRSDAKKLTTDSRELAQVLSSLQYPKNPSLTTPIKVADNSDISPRSNMARKEQPFINIIPCDDSINSSVGPDTKSKQLLSVTPSYRGQKASFNLDDLDTVRSQYTLQTPMTNRFNLADDSLNGREEMSKSGDILASIGTDQTLVSNYSAISGQTSSVVDVSSYHANNSLSRLIAADEYRGKIKKLSLLGGGSEAKVWLVKLPEAEELAALKLYEFIKKETKQAEGYEALRKEFKLLKSFSHPNIIQYCCLYKPKRTAYDNCIEYGIVMEYMSGGSLEKYIEQSFAKITLAEKKSFIKQLFSGLAYLHDANVMHRDLKPANLLLSSDRKYLKLSDFGISKRLEEGKSAPQTMLGTPWYMAPEVVNEEPYSLKADIWSAGCCVFHLMSGKRPYHESTYMQVLMNMVNNKNPLSTCDETVKTSLQNVPYLWNFLTLCLSQDKAARPTARELLKHPFLKDAPVLKDNTLLPNSSILADPNLLMTGEHFLDAVVLSYY